MDGRARTGGDCRRAEAVGWVHEEALGIGLGGRKNERKEGRKEGGTVIAKGY